ncbi:MAG: PAS domain-containing protein [Verrucomicrobia bacterium]|nr:PAS domain-containing protein [Verrucomicrobiota bacterium]
MNSSRGTSEMLEATQRLALTLDAAQLGTWDWDMMTNAVIWSPHYFQLFGFTPGTLTPSHERWLASIHPDDRPQAQDALRRALDHRAPYHSIYRVVWPSGETHWIEGRGFFLRDATGLPYRMLGVIMNIDSQRTLEAERERAARLESLGLVAGGIAHDFNNHLASISACVEVVRLDARLGPESAAQLTEALRVVGQAQALTRQLITFAKGGTLRKASIDLHDLITDTVGFALRGSPIQVEFELAADLAPVEADPSQIQQVISSLVVNARQALAGPGRVRVRAAHRRLETVDPVAGLGPGKFVEVTIEDDGPGIAPEHRNKLFTPYFTTKAGGTGLGLATAHSIVRRHGGSIVYQPVQPHGTRFSILLRASEPAAAEEAPRPSEARPARQRLLLMDDNQSLLTSLVRLLKARGYDVEATASGEECERRYLAARDAGQGFEAVVLDLTVPGGRGGVETFAALRQIDPDLTGIAMSGYAEVESNQALERQGFAGVLAKPFKCEDLTGLLERVRRA